MKLKILFPSSIFLFLGALYPHLCFSQGAHSQQGGNNGGSSNSVIGGFLNQNDPNAVYAGALDNCPFNPPKSSDVNSLMSALTSSLVALKNQCPNLNETISAIEKGINESTNQFNVLLTQKSPIDPQSANGKLPNPEISQVTLSCSNYKLLLAREYDILQDRLDQTGTENIPSRYLNCFSSGPDPSNKKKCISKSYNQSLSQIQRNCVGTYTVKVDDSLKRSLNSISEGFTNLMNSNPSCGGNSSSLVAEVGINVAQALSVIPGSLGWAGAGINLFANSIISLIQKSNYENSPVAALEKIAARKKSKFLMCLWFQFQNKKLRCHEFFKNPNIDTQTFETSMCAHYFSGPLKTNQHTNIRILQDELQRISTKPNAPERIDEFNFLLNSKILDPLNEGDSVTLITHLEEIASTLQKSNDSKTSKADMALGVNLANLIQLQKSLTDSKFTAKNPNYVDELKKLNESMVKSINAFSMEKAVDAYWRVKGKEDPYFYIKNLSTLDPPNDTSDGTLSYNGHESDIMLGTNAMIKYFQDSFDSDLSVLGKSYVAAVDESDNNRVYTTAIELAKVCFLNAGIYYAKFPSQDDLSVNDALNRINDAPTKAYEKACKVFSCLNKNNSDKIGSLFKPKSSGTETSKEFRAYQCQNLKNYDIILNKIKSQISAKGKLCD